MLGNCNTLTHSHTPPPPLWPKYLYQSMQKYTIMWRRWNETVSNLLTLLFPLIRFSFSPISNFSYTGNIGTTINKQQQKLGFYFSNVQQTLQKMHSAIFLLYKWAIIIFKQKKSFFSETFIITTIMHDHTSLYTHSTNVTKHDRSQIMINAIFFGH